MTTGRRKRVMIACVTFETSKVADPVGYYDIDEAHLIHYSRNPSDEDNVYNAFYRRVTELIAEIPRKVEIVEHNEVVFDFSTMLRTVLEIIHRSIRDDGAEVYVNVSAGSSEYTAASTIASMMVPGTVPFSVNTREYTVDKDMIRDLYYIDGQPVGLTKVAGEPKTLPCYAIDIPEEHLVRGLRILDSRISRRLPTSSPSMVAALKEEGLWYRDTDERAEKKTSKKQTEAVYYQRDFMAKWMKNRWVDKDERTGKHVLTDRGRMIIDTFYTVRGRITFVTSITSHRYYTMSGMLSCFPSRRTDMTQYRQTLLMPMPKQNLSDKSWYSDRRGRKPTNRRNEEINSIIAFFKRRGIAGRLPRLRPDYKRIMHTGMHGRGWKALRPHGRAR